MSEYISRDEVLEHSEYTGNFNLVVPVRFIKAMKSADVQLVKRGRWIITDDVEHFIAVCSECGRTEDSRAIKDMPYCHCGARMDGDAE